MPVMKQIVKINKDVNYNINSSLKLILEVYAKDITNIPIIITSGYRTKAEQAILFKNKKSKCDGTIKRSNHQDGKAFDFAINDNENLYNTEMMDIVIDKLFFIAAKYNIVIKSGKNFKGFIDYPHIEI